MTLVLLASRTSEADEIDYKTATGDTCESIAKKMLEDGKRCDEIRTLNPSVAELKDDKGKLKAGTALKVPKPKPPATISATEGVVDVSGTSAKKDAAIVPGSGIVSSANAHTEVTYKEGWRVLVAPSSTFYVLGKAAPKGSKKLVTGDSTLVTGSVRVTVPATIAKAAPIDTPAGKLTFTASTEAKVHVEDGATRVSVHKGKATLGATEIAEGSGLKVDKGKWGGKSQKLPDAPKWTAAPKTSYSVATSNEEAKLTGMIGGTATKWHLQVSMDAQFTEYLVDLELKAAGPTLMLEQKLPVGKFYLRVSALDDNGLESAWSPVATTVIEKIEKPEKVAKPPDKPSKPPPKSK